MNAFREKGMGWRTILASGIVSILLASPCTVFAWGGFFGDAIDGAKDLGGKISGAAKDAGGAIADFTKKNGAKASDWAKEQANKNISVTAEWQYQAWVPDPYRQINFAVREMFYDTTASHLTFQVIGRVPIRADGKAKIPGRLSASLKADMDVDYSANVSVDFSAGLGRITAQPRVQNLNAQLQNVRFNAELANWFRGRIQDSLNQKIQSEKPRVQRLIEEAIAKLNLTVEGQDQLRNIAEKIRSQLSATRSGVNNVHVASLDALNSTAWKTRSGQRHYAKASPLSIARPTMPNRIDLQYLGAGIGGAVEEYLKQQFANYRKSDSGRETWRPYQK